MGDYTVLLYAGFGGVANEILHWYGLRKNKQLPHYLKSWFYWCITLVMILIGTVVPRIQLGVGGDPIIAFQLGLAMPLILKKLSSVAPEPKGGMDVRGGPSLKDFLRG
jgi:hypothetical protein